MLKKTVRYKDFNDQEVTEDLYFNLSKSEIVEWHIDGFVNFLSEMTKPEVSDDEKVKAFKKIIGLAYGVRSEDGRRFKKSEEQTADFLTSPAYDALFMELVTSPDSAAIEFVLGMLPADLGEEAKGMVASGKVGGVPVTIPTGPERLTLGAQPSVIAVKPESSTVPEAFRRKEAVDPGIAAIEAELAKRKAARVKPLSEMTEDELLAELARRKNA